MGRTKLLAGTFDWNGPFAYAIGLLTSDGNLSNDGRHLEFCSKDKELVKSFCKCLGLRNKITLKGRGTPPYKTYYRVQFGNVKLYRYLLSIGLLPRKSLALRLVSVPKEFYPDFLRGLLDGDGNINIFKHPESSQPQLRVRFYSASFEFLSWLKEEIHALFGLKGFFRGMKGRDGAFSLTYAKQDSIVLLNRIYYRSNLPYLMRKFKVAEPFLKARA